MFIESDVLIFLCKQIKAIYPIAKDTTERMISFIKKENAKEGFDGFDAKDVKFSKM